MHLYCTFACSVSYSRPCLYYEILRKILVTVWLQTWGFYRIWLLARDEASLGQQSNLERGFNDELHPYATLSYGSSLFSHCLFKFSCILKIPSKAFFGLFLRFAWKEERNKRWVDLWTTCFIDEQNRLAASRILTSSRVGCSQFVGVFFPSFFVPYFFSYCFHPIS